MAILAVLLIGGVSWVISSAETAPPPAASPPTSAAALPSTTTSTAPPKRVTVPRGLAGINAQRAYSQLQQAGFTNITFGTTDADDEIVLYPPNWTVTDVEPGGGTQMMSDEPVVIMATKRD